MSWPLLLLGAYLSVNTVSLGINLQLHSSLHWHPSYSPRSQPFFQSLLDIAVLPAIPLRPQNTPTSLNWVKGGWIPCLLAHAGLCILFSAIGLCSHLHSLHLLPIPTPTEDLPLLLSMFSCPLLPDSVPTPTFGPYLHSKIHSKLLLLELIVLLLIEKRLRTQLKIFKCIGKDKCYI